MAFRQHFEHDCTTSHVDPEAGYLLVGVVVLVALVLIALSVAAPVVAKDLRRQKELESQHRAEQYVRAIRLYYRKTHSYPPSIEALKQTNNVRFLRQEYVDPLTGQSNWKLIHLGEQKTTIKVFFGQELAGIGSGGLGSSLGSGLGSAAGLSSGLGSPVGGSSTTTSTIGATSPLASGFPGASTTSTSQTGTGGIFGSTGSTGSSGLGGGGGAIIGVGTAATGSSITTPNQQATYENWEFWYDPRIEQLYAKGKLNGGIGSGSPASQSTSSFGTNLNGQSNNPNSASPFSSSPLGTSTTPTAPTTTTTPQP